MVAVEELQPWLCSFLQTSQNFVRKLIRPTFKNCVQSSKGIFTEVYCSKFHQPKIFELNVGQASTRLDPSLFCQWKKLGKGKAKCFVVYCFRQTYYRWRNRVGASLGFNLKSLGLFRVNLISGCWFMADQRQKRSCFKPPYPFNRLQWNLN